MSRRRAAQRVVRERPVLASRCDAIQLGSSPLVAEVRDAGFNHTEMSVALVTVQAAGQIIRLSVNATCHSRGMTRALSSPIEP